MGADVSFDRAFTATCDLGFGFTRGTPPDTRQLRIRGRCEVHPIPSRVRRPRMGIWFAARGDPGRIRPRRYVLEVQYAHDERATEGVHVDRSRATQARRLRGQGVPLEPAGRPGPPCPCLLGKLSPSFTEVTEGVPKMREGATSRPPEIPSLLLGFLARPPGPRSRIFCAVHRVTFLGSSKSSTRKPPLGLVYPCKRLASKPSKR